VSFDSTVAGPAIAEPDATAVWMGATPHDRAENICIIGAGASGLTAIKNLREYGFGVDCYERETGVGGAWNWRHDRSPVYASTHLISSKPFTQYPDFPMPDSWPDYPHHSQVLAYLERYADHFGLREHIWFGTEVTKVIPTEDGRWDVTISGARGGGSDRTQRYAAVIVANGHNWSPKLPSYEGLVEFKGDAIHASAYKDAAQLRGRRVLVVGAGNTGCDLAVEAAQQASRCWHSSRQGYWYIPKYLYGRPADQVSDLTHSLGLSLRTRQWLAHRAVRRTVGDLTRFGLSAPDHKIYETHPIVNSQLVYYLGHGAITAVPDIATFTRDGVEFTDGRVAEPDLVIFATGYLPRFEFLSPDLLNVDAEGRPRLFLHAFSPTHPTLAVVGLLQPDAGVFSLMHWQAVTIATWLRLRESAPERADAFWRRHLADVSARYNRAKVKQSTRHWFEVNHVEYLKAVERALREMEATV
jgi:cation diffusion facilitator CzcD-associated flavoprotein CzcO